MLLVLLALPAACDGPAPSSVPPSFDRVQPDLFSTPGAQPNAWADYDGDGDLDLFVGMRYSENRLYRNDAGHFVDVAAALGLADLEDTRAAAWGDYDGDGDPDLYVGYPTAAGTPNRLYRNDGHTFVDVATGLGMDLVGTTRQPSWIDYDGDGDLDLFVAMRDQPNRMFRNDGPAGERAGSDAAAGDPADDGPASEDAADDAAAAAAAWSFTDVTGESGLGDPRRTVGVAWFDFDRDGDLDVHVSNQNGDEDAFFRNEGDGTFIDVAPALGMNHPNRGDEYGSVVPAVTDYDNDGDLDLFIAAYGPDVLWSNNGDGTFTDVTDPATLGVDHHSTTAAWGDADNDGLPDLIVASFLTGIPAAEDHLFMNAGVGGSSTRFRPTFWSTGPATASPGRISTATAPWTSRSPTTTRPAGPTTCTGTSFPPKPRPARCRSWRWTLPGGRWSPAPKSSSGTPTAAGSWAPAWWTPVAATAHRVRHRRISAFRREWNASMSG